MARSFLRDVNKHAHLFATIFFFVYSGFGWIYFVQQKLQNFDPGQNFNLLDRAVGLTYFDVGDGMSSWYWLWFRPVTLGLTITFIMFYLMKQKSLTKLQFISFFSLLVLTVSQVHFSEVAIFVVLLFVLTLLKPRIELRVVESAISIIIGLVISAGFSFIYRHFLNSEFQISSDQYLPFLIVLAILIIFLVRFNARPRFSFKLRPVFIASIALFLFCIFIIIWSFNPNLFSMQGDLETLGVPWVLYPVLLGIVGAIAIPGIILLIMKNRNHPLMIFGVLFLLAIAIGKVVSFANSNYFSTGYYERRIFPLTFAAASILASLIVAEILKEGKLFGNFKLNNTSKTILISSLILVGSLSTFLTLDYRVISTPLFGLNDTEIKLLNSLSNIDTHSTLLTLSDASRDMAQYSKAGQVLDEYRFLIWPSNTPEVALSVMSPLDSPTTIFLSDSDMQEIAKTYNHLFIERHFLKVGDMVYKGNGGEVLQIPPVSSPSPISNMILVMQEDPPKYDYAYDVLSLGLYNYSTALLADVNSISKGTIIIAPDEKIASETLLYKKEYGLQFKKLIILDLVGSDKVLNIMNSTSNSVILRENDSKWVSYPMQTIPKNIPTFSHKTYGDSEIYYFNLKPIIAKLEVGHDDTRQLYPSLGRLLELTNETLPSYKISKRSSFSTISGGVTAFGAASFYGNTTVKSPSAIIMADQGHVKVYSKGIISEYNNVSKIIPISVDNISIKSNSGSISGGYGFYSNAIFNSTSVTQFSGNPAVVSMIYKNQSSIKVTGKEIQLSVPKSHILVREPVIKSENYTKFNQFYGFGQVPAKIAATNEELSLSGPLTLDVRYPGNPTVARNSSFMGTVIHSSLTPQKDDLQMLSNVFNPSNHPYLIATAVAFIIVNYYINRRKNKFQGHAPTSN
jgi:hypothetical protein